MGLLAAAALAVGGYLATHPSAGPAIPSPPSVKGRDGWQPLFNGRDLTGWTVSKSNKYDNWGAEDDILYTTGAKRNWLLTEQEYDDFEVRLEYRLTDRANSGVGLRAENGGDKEFDGLEVQILDDAGYGYGKPGLKPTELNGALFGLAAPAGTAARPAGEWNRMEVTARGRDIKVKVNGAWVLQADLDRYVGQTARFPGLSHVRGRIGLQSHTGRVEFRELFVRSLPPDTVPAEKLPVGQGGGVRP